MKSLKFNPNNIFKSPAFVGFFSFLTVQFLFLYLLQFLSRSIFIFFKKTQFASLKLLFVSSYHGFLLDLSMLCYPLLWILFCYILFQIFNRNWILKLTLPIVVLMVISSVVIAFSDAELYHVWGTKNNSQSVQYLRSPKEAFASASAGTWAVVIPFTLIFGSLAAYYYYRLISKNWKQVNANRRGKIILAIPAFVLAGIGLRGGLQTIPISQSRVYYSQNTFENYTAVNSTWNFLYYVFNKSEVIVPEKYRFGLPKGESYWKQYTVTDTTAEFTPLSKINKPNVVLVILESFSAYTSKYFCDSFDCTPFLDSLAQTGITFTNAYSQGDRTDKGLACVIGGWPGQPWQGIINEPDKGAKLPSLARIFNQQGYQSSFYYGGDLAFANMRAYLTPAGYQNMVDENVMNLDKPGFKWGYHDADVLNYWLSSIQSAKQPFFSTILTLSSHEPFTVPGWKKLNDNNEFVRFRNSVRYVDNCLRNWIHKAASQPWFNNTLFVFVADHGRQVGLGNMDYWQPAHFRIPIVFWGPVLNGGPKVYTQTASQTDIGTTLHCGLFGAKPGYFPFGRNLLAPHADMTAYFFSNGFGVLSPEGHVVWENNPPRITEKSGKATTDMLLLGKSLQLELISRYKNF